MFHILFLIAFACHGQIDLSSDKFKHDQAGMCISGVACSSGYLFGMNAWQSTGFGFVVSGFAGICKELYDKYSGKGTPEVMDAVATGFGGARMCIMWRIGVDVNEKKREKIKSFQNKTL